MLACLFQIRHSWSNYYVLEVFKTNPLKLVKHHSICGKERGRELVVGKVGERERGREGGKKGEGGKECLQGRRDKSNSSKSSL